MSKASQSVASVRFESPGDVDLMRRINTEAFNGPAEANLVEALGKQGQIMVSLVAEVGKELVGNVVLTPVTVMPTVPGLRMLGLGPVAVLPKFQRQGIGSMLIRQAIGQACADGWQAIVVLGHPDYYRRFGFIPASRFGLGCEFDAPEGAFVVLELRPGTLEGLHGVVRYQPEFLMV
jgi:putative acetyltransferase